MRFNPTMIKNVISIAEQAAKAILDVYGKRDYETFEKSDQSPVTEADLAANRVIVEGLSKLDSSIPILSEESEDIPWSTRKAWDKYWLVDPLDGTKEFIKGNGEFTVNIALIEHNQPTIGVVYVPVKGVCYFAEKNRAWVKKESQIQEIHTSKKVENQPWRVLGSRSSYSHLNDKFIDSLGEHTLISAGSSLKFCLIAEGLADIYPRYVPTSEWDTAAAHCILKAAGGEVLNAKTLEPLSYNQKASYLNDFFIAIGQECPEIMKIGHSIQPYITSNE